MSKYVPRKHIEVTPQQIFLMSFILTALALASLLLFNHMRKVDVNSFWVFDFSGERFTDESNATVVVYPEDSFGVWEAWGTSLAWWAATFGDREDLADMLFTLGEATIEETGQRLPGLGLNSVRFNAGGGGWTTVHGEGMQVSPNIPNYKQIEGFWVDDCGADDPGNPSCWNWNADMKQVFVPPRRA